ncbi:RNA pseudouridine synthase, partial [Candidatus Saccharibacteria bacterium]
MVKTIIVTEEQAGKRLDVAIVALIDMALSRAYIQKLCVDGQVQLNGVIAPGKSKVAEGD